MKMVKAMAGLCSETPATCACAPENEFGMTSEVAFNVLETIGHLTFSGKAGINNGQ